MAKIYPTRAPTTVPAAATTEQNQADEQGRVRLELRLGRLAARAVTDFNMLEAGDRVLVAVSGGKDSYVMLRLLQRMRRIAPIDFDLLAVHIDQGQPGFPVADVRAQMAATGVDHLVVRQNTYAVVKEKLKPGVTTCSLCSRLRRGILYTQADKLGCNKIALGHHRDDLVHTLLMNQIFSGQLKSMAPRLLSDSGRNIVIRPLAYCPEALIIEYAKAIGYEPIPCTLCSGQEDHKRTLVKELVDELERRFPKVRDSLFASLQNVRESHLLDARLAPSIVGGGPGANAESDARREDSVSRREASDKRGNKGTR